MLLIVEDEMLLIVEDDEKVFTLLQIAIPRMTNFSLDQIIRFRNLSGVQSAYDEGVLRNLKVILLDHNLTGCDKGEHVHSFLLDKFGDNLKPRFIGIGSNREGQDYIRDNQGIVLGKPFDIKELGREINKIANERLVDSREENTDSPHLFR